MTIPGQTDAPIYNRLIAERGDVPADTQRIAVQTLQEAAEILDWSSPIQDEEPATDTLTSDTGHAAPQPERAV
ncbi:hypothetical protein [Streptomyces sp. NPDC058330]|uniref:hypothetical protein n=1 Tax=Streptomyces sp. NPDC058330 TaxID=3346449 RepID=UPI0036EE0051